MTLIVIASNVFEGRDDSSGDANEDIDDCHGNSDADDDTMMIMMMTVMIVMCRKGVNV